MNTEKLLAVAVMLENDEREHGIQSILHELTTSINENNAEQIEIRKNELIDLLESGSSYKFTPTEFSILHKIGGASYYGRDAVREVKSFFSFDMFKLKENLDKYRQERKQFISVVRQLVAGLEITNFEPHHQTNDYEIGIILPSSFLSLNKTIDALSKWNKFLNTVADIKKIDKTSNISLVSQGSIELYILAALPLAMAVNLVLDELIKMYTQVSFIRTQEENLKILKNDRIQAELKTEREQIENKFVEKVTKELIKDVKFKDIADKNDSTSRLSGQVSTIFKLHKEGVTLEIKPPEIDIEIDENLSEKDREKRKKEIIALSLETKRFSETNQKVLESDIEESRLLLEKGSCENEDELRIESI